jgi:EAL and modified HD-GYP domain-containing signal transduction protein
MQLLLYSRGRQYQRSFAVMAATRGKLMETLAKTDPESAREDHDAAFMTGILWLIDVLLELPREQIFAELLISDEVKEALISRTGGLGHLLRLAEKLEEDDHTGIKELIAGIPGLSLDGLLQMQLEAFMWANSIDKEAA